LVDTVSRDIEQKIRMDFQVWLQTGVLFSPFSCYLTKSPKPLCRKGTHMLMWNCFKVVIAIFFRLLHVSRSKT